MLVAPDFSSWRAGGGGGGPAADFPAVSSVARSSTDTASTSHTIQLPPVVDSGDLLLVMIRCASSVTAPSAPAGWTLVATRGRTGIYSKTASGSEDGTTVSFTTASSIRTAHHSYAIKGWNAVESIVNASLANDPPSLTPSWGAKNTLWFAVGGANSTNWTPTPPANYEPMLLGTNPSSAVTDRCQIASARRELNATSEDPAGFGGVMTTPETITLAIEPADGWTGISPAATPYLTGLSSSTLLDSFNPSKTYTGVDFGGADTVVVFIGTDSSSTNHNAPTVTIDGISGTLVAKVGDGTERTGSIYYADITNPSGNIVVTYAGGSNNIDRHVVHVYGLSGLASSTPTDSVTDSTSPTALGSLDVSNNGYIIAGMRGHDAADIIWTGLEEDGQLAVGQREMSCASRFFATGETNHAITADQAGSVANRLVAASWS